MNKEEIIDKLRALMKDSSQADVDWGTVSTESTIESLGFDSLTILDLVYDIQQGIGVEFEAEELVSIKTVGELADFLHGKSNG